MAWWIGAAVVWLASAVCIIGTIAEVLTGRKRPFQAENLGAYVFHGATAVLALWLLMNALGR
jgi:hypothetical protein